MTPSLDRIKALLDLLGSPQDAVPVIHVAGTNGKTSTTRMIDALLQEFGLRTGRFTSPHLHSMRERIAFDGQPIDEERFVAAYDDVAPYLPWSTQQFGVRLSFFEVLTAMAYAAFADAPVDVASSRSAWAGRWDATNVADAQVAVVTPIALDHVRWLGSTVEQIAGEKAGIIKPGSFAVLAQQEVAVVRGAAAPGGGGGLHGRSRGPGVRRLSRSLAVGGQLLGLRGLGGEYDDVFLPLIGAHQAHNAACALAAVEAFLGGGLDAAARSTRSRAWPASGR